MSRPYNEGGLGLRNVEITNCAANLRHMMSGKSTIWTEWIHKSIINN